MFLALSRGCFSPRLRFFVDKIKKGKSLKCPILCISIITCFFKVLYVMFIIFFHNTHIVVETGGGILFLTWCNFAQNVHF